MIDDNFYLDVGIDAVGFYAPKNRLLLKDLAKKRGIDPAKFKYGLLAEEIAVPDYGEDAVSMAMMAANNAFSRGNIDPKEIEAIFVGSESLPYAVKSIASILSVFLGVNENSFTGDTLHACAGATIGILNAIGLINTGIINKALVIGTDISKYPIGSPGEPTQGAGAVAIVISKDPRIARIGSKFGKVSGHVNDFFRTLYSENAEVFGHYSTNAYLHFVLKTYDDFKKQAGPFLADYYVFHAPFGKMPIKSFQKIMFERWINNPEKRKLMVEKYKNRQFTREEKDFILSGKEELHLKTVEMLRNSGFSDDEILRFNYFYKDWFTKKMLPCLDVPMRFGNMYSASLWAQIVHLMETRVKEGDQIYFTSYGSGATAISGIFKMVPGFRKYLSKGPFVLDFIRKKSPIPLEYYEMYKRNLLPANVSIGTITAAPENTRGIKICHCSEGCILPQHQELAYCPKGHEGSYERWYPLIAEVEDILDKEVDVSQKSYSPDTVYIMGDVRPGEKVELVVRRLKVDEDPDVQGYGLIHWFPVYVSLNQ
ncbi:MAG: hydroxymethylglutaryl-CoA synthase family protein [Promethearchaeota archaeon]